MSSFMHDEWQQNKIEELEGKLRETESTLNRIDGKMGTIEEFYRSSQADITRIENQASTTRDRLDDHRTETSGKLTIVQSQISGIVMKNSLASVVVGVMIALAAVVIVYMYVDTKYQHLDTENRRIEKSIDDQGEEFGEKLDALEDKLKEIQKQRELKNVQS